MSKINYQRIYNINRNEWKALTSDNGEKYEMLISGFYSENNHFIYELLQNADDENATLITFDYYDDKIIVYHNGKPFDEKDVIGICSFLEEKKDKNDARTIGKFGLGFKSVFKYTNQPEVYSNDEAFRIERYLLPVEITDVNVRNSSLIILNEEKVKPISDDENITKFILPYKDKIINNEASVRKEDIIEKLIGLEPNILLFLHSIEKIIWIDNCNHYYGSYEKSSIDDSTVSTHFQEGELIECQSYSSSDDKLVRQNYLVFRDAFPLDEMEEAEIKIAYTLNKYLNKIETADLAKTWVYFPTRDDSHLKFLIHGTYETPISREKIMNPSRFNDALFEKTENLVIKSFKYLKINNILNQGFIKDILLASCNDSILRGLKEKINKAFMENQYLPTKNGGYGNPDALVILVPHDLDSLLSIEQIQEYNKSNVDVIYFSDPRNSSDYYSWITDEIGVKIYTIEDYSRLLLRNPIADKRKADSILEYLNNLNQRFYSKYGEDFNKAINNAWKQLKYAKLITNEENQLVAANDVYLSCDNDFIIIPKSALVSAELVGSYKDFLVEKFAIEEYNNWKYVKEKVIIKYKSNEFKSNDNWVSEHITDIKQIISLYRNHDNYKVNNLIQGINLIKIKDDEKIIFKQGPNIWLPIAEDGVSIKDYFEDITKNDYVDLQFYTSHGITIGNLVQLGVKNTIIIGLNREGGELTRRWREKGGLRTFQNKGDFRYYFNLLHIEKVLSFIDNNKESISAKNKSKIIFSILINNYSRIHGPIQKGTNSRSSVIEISDAEIIRELEDHKWLYTHSGELVNQQSISKYELDEYLYGEVNTESRLYQILKFAQKSEDYLEECNDILRKSNNKQTEEFLLDSLLKKRYGNHISINELDTNFKTNNKELNTDYPYMNFDDKEFTFPSKKIRNIELLRKHIQEHLYYADPIRFEYVYSSRRSSIDRKSIREYLKDNYIIEDSYSQVYACQLCQKGSSTFHAVEIEEKPKKLTPSKELEQMFLCLCPICAGEYKEIRRKKDNANEFINNIIYANTEADKPIIVYVANKTIYFTQTHLAEIQEIIRIFGKEQTQAEVDSTAFSS